MIEIQTNINGQQWAQGRLMLEFQNPGAWESMEQAYAEASALISELKRQGFGVTGSSVGTRYRSRGCTFDGIEVVVDAVRGGRPSAIELKMQSTFSGRD